MISYRSVITEILTEYNIPYWEQGKNVSPDTINVQCPFCGDHSNHCGIFESNLIYHCWRCKAKGGFADLLAELTNKSPGFFRRLVRTRSRKVDVAKGKKYLEHKQDPNKLPTRSEGDKPITYPPNSYSINKAKGNALLRSWMKERRLEPRTLIKHKCKLCIAGDWGGRVIVPVYVEGEMKGFVGADVTGEKSIKYKMSDKRVKEYVYGYDDYDDDRTPIIVEGILDKWRIGKRALATFGTTITESQVSHILSLHPSKLIICMDADAYWHSRQTVVRFFSAHVDRIKIVRFPVREDPDSYGRKATMQLIKETKWL